VSLLNPGPRHDGLKRVPSGGFIPDPGDRDKTGPTQSRARIHRRRIRKIQAFPRVEKLQQYAPTRNSGCGLAAMTERSGEVQLKALLQSAQVGQLTLKVRHQLAPSDSFGSAMALMRNRSHGCALVCEEGTLVGIVTERDILHGLHSGIDRDAPLESVMTSQPVTVTSRDTLFDAIALMDTGGYRRLPVLDDAGAPEGVVDVKTVTGFLVEHYAEAVHNQASQAEATARNREGA